MILGAIVGDIVGSPYEYGVVEDESGISPMKTKSFPLFCENSVFTDDTTMTVAVADALMRSYEGCQPLSYALVRSMRDWGRKYPGVGYGESFMKWIEDRMAHPRPYRSKGNGAGMRVSPVAWMFDTLEVVELVAAETAKVTHNHPEGIKGAQAIAAAVFLARTGAGKAEIRKYLQQRYGYELRATLDEMRPSFRFDVTSPASVPPAIECYLESTVFEDAIRNAVSLGGDSDTIGAMAASIAQAEYGIPAEIEAQARLRLPPDLLEMNDRFCSHYLPR